jgi:phosphate transport system ATP-binding protein
LKALLDIENLQVSCHGKPLLKSTNLTIADRSINSVVGPSGAGKTTLLRSINGLLDRAQGYEVSGKIMLRQRVINAIHSNKFEVRRKIGLVFQKPTIFPTTVFKNVIFGAKHIAPRSRQEYEALVEECLKSAFLWDELKDRLHDSALHLSIGQQQRLAISRSLAVNPDVLMMDEPTASLDKRATEKIEALIHSLGQKKSVILVTHDMGQAEALSDQIISIATEEGGAVVTTAQSTKKVIS